MDFQTRRVPLRTEPGGKRRLTTIWDCKENETNKRRKSTRNPNYSTDPSFMGVVLDRKDADGTPTYGEPMDTEESVAYRYASEVGKGKDCPIGEDGVPTKLIFDLDKMSVGAEFVEKLKAILRKRIEVFATNYGKPSQTSRMKARIETGDAPPQFMPARRVSPVNRGRSSLRRSIECWRMEL